MSHSEKSAILEKNITERARPLMFKVILINDQFTTMEFVMTVLVDIFDHTPEKAEAIMLTVHHEGRGVCGVYSFEVAQTKQVWALRAAEKYDFPLAVKIEPLEE